MLLLGVVQAQAAGGAPIKYFIAAHDGGGVGKNNWLNENAYVTCISNTLEKFDAAGNLVAAYAYTGNNGIATVHYDSVNEAIYINSSNSSTYYLTKLDLGLDVVWSRSANVSAGTVSQIRTNAAGRIFYGINWTQGGTANQDAGIWHIDGDGTNSNFLFASQSAPYNREAWEDVAFDASDNIYGFGRWSTGNTNDYRYHLAKWDSAGNWDWSYYSNQTSKIQNWISDAAFDSAGYLYVAVSYGRESWLIKLDVSGGTPTILWQRSLFDAQNTTDRGRSPSVVIDSNDDVYLSYMYRQGVHIAKYDGTGTIVWERNFNQSSSGNNSMKLAYATEGHLVGSWNLGLGPSDAFIFSLPTDGDFLESYSFAGYTTVVSTTSKAYTNPSSTITSFTPANRSNNALTASTVSVTKSTTTDTWTTIGP